MNSLVEYFLSAKSVFKFSDLSNRQVDKRQGFKWFLWKSPIRLLIIISLVMTVITFEPSYSIGQVPFSLGAKIPLEIIVIVNTSGDSARKMFGHQRHDAKWKNTNCKLQHQNLGRAVQEFRPRARVSSNLVVGRFICWTYVAWLALFDLVGWLDGLLRFVWFGLGCLRRVVAVK